MPHVAAAPMRTTKTKPLARPEVVLLLQTWSTATSQTMNSAIATAASTLIHTFPLLEGDDGIASKTFGTFATVRIFCDAEHQ